MKTEYKRNKISKWRWREIKAILMQYDERKARAKDVIKLPSQAGGPGIQKNTISNITASQAEQIIKITAINDKIDGVLAQFDDGDILRRCYSYDVAKLCGYSKGKNSYYREKRAMFVMLDEVL